MVEGTGLENRQACKRLVGSNPTPSATCFAEDKHLMAAVCMQLCVQIAHADIFDFEIVIEAVFGTLAALAGLLDTAERDDV